MVGGKMLFKKRRGEGRRRESRRESEENVTGLGKFKVTAPSTAAGSRRNDRRRNFAARRPCVCARGSVSECARVAGCARERAGVGAGWSGEKGEAGVREGARAQVSWAEEARSARSPAAAAASRAGFSTPGHPAARLAPRLTRPSEEAAAGCRCPEPREIGTSS